MKLSSRSSAGQAPRLALILASVCILPFAFNTSRAQNQSMVQPQPLVSPSPLSSDTVNYNFINSNCQFSPTAPLVYKNGLLYGTTPGDAAGGGNCGGGNGSNNGNAFTFNPSTNTYTSIWSASSGTPEGNPAGQVAVDGVGNVYGASAGSVLIGEGDGAVWELVYDSTTKTYSETTLHSFQTSPSTDGCAPRGGVTLDAAGNLYGTTSSCGANNDGTIWKLTKSGTSFTFSVLHTLTSASGTDPVGPLQVATFTDYGGAPTTHLFGTASEGGITNSNCSNGCGTVWEIDSGPAGTKFTTLHSFTGGATDGSSPQGGVYFSSSGMELIGTTNVGGTGTTNCSSGCGTIFTISGLNTESILYSFKGGSDGQYPDGTLVADASGNLYGTTSTGGSNNFNRNGTLYMLTKSTSDYTYSQIYSFGSSSVPNDALNPTGALALDGSTLYGTSVNGGNDGGASNCDGHSCGTIYSIPVQ
jgi:uncharacterized repeat protein (TIGR03803 family)